MQCIHCQGTLVSGETSYAANRHGYHLILDGLPAWICAQCGEPLFDLMTVEAIQDMLRAVDTRWDQLAMTSAVA